MALHYITSRWNKWQRTHSISSHIFFLSCLLACLLKLSTWSKDLPFLSCSQFIVPIHFTIPTTDTWVADQVLDGYDKSFVATSLTLDTATSTIYTYSYRFRYRVYLYYESVECKIFCTFQTTLPLKLIFFGQKFVTKAFDHGGIMYSDVSSHTISLPNAI